MKNVQITAVEDNKKYWISRSLVISPIVWYYNGDFNKEKNNINISDIYILIARRGKGADGANGLWNIPGGYIDYDETCEIAAARELYEETGYKFNPVIFNLFNIISNNYKNTQNIICIYEGQISKNIITYRSDYSNLYECTNKSYLLNKDKKKISILNSDNLNLTKEIKNLNKSCNNISLDDILKNSKEELDETDMLTWISLDNIDDYSFAFNHNKILKDFKCYISEKINKNNIKNL